jgi:hypothetical protein
MQVPEALEVREHVHARGGRADGVKHCGWVQIWPYCVSVLLIVLQLLAQRGLLCTCEGVHLIGPLAVASCIRLQWTPWNTFE